MTLYIVTYFYKDRWIIKRHYTSLRSAKRMCSDLVKFNVSNQTKINTVSLRVTLTGEVTT